MMEPRRTANSNSAVRLIGALGLRLSVQRRQSRPEAIMDRQSERLKHRHPSGILGLAGSCGLTSRYTGKPNIRALAIPLLFSFSEPAEFLSLIAP